MLHTMCVLQPGDSAQPVCGLFSPAAAALFVSWLHFAKRLFLFDDLFTYVRQLCHNALAHVHSVRGLLLPGLDHAPRTPFRRLVRSARGPACFVMFGSVAFRAATRRVSSAPSFVLRRSFAKEANKGVAKATPASAAPPAAATSAQVPVSAAPKRRSPFFDRLSAFVAGTAIAAAVGYWKLHNDVWDSTMQVCRRRNQCTA
mgnify:CR=1 FL=1